MKHDEIQLKEPIIDLLYPSKEKRNNLKKRHAELSTYPRDFIANLEIERLAEQICPHYNGRIVDMLTEICDDADVIKYRLDILEDLINVPSLSAIIKKIIDIIVQNDRKNIYKLSEPDSFAKLDDAITAFEAYVECIEIMHKFHSENSNRIKSEGIIKMFDYFEGIYNDKHFKNIKAENCDLKKAVENKIKSVTIAINLDERMIPISAGIVEYSENPYSLNPSLFDRILYHGYKFKNKNIVQNMKSRYQENNFDEEKIINTADKNLFESLSFLTDGYIEMLNDVLSEYQKIGLDDMYYLSYQLEYYMGAIDMIRLCENSGLKMCRPEILPTSERKAEIKGLFDMIYFSESRRWNLNHQEHKSVVTNDISFDNENGFYILTGVNNGGKTTFVRALGICQIMAQTGLYVPAESCKISLVDYVYTHFPKEEQTGINSSRFTTEIKELKTISDTATDTSLLLMNESIQSTTPNECVDIAGEILKIFCLIGVRGIFATHLLDLAQRIDDINSANGVKSKVESIIMAANSETGERTYKVQKGLPTKTSDALTILREFGIKETDVRKRIGDANK